MKLTENFDSSEFACKDGTPVPENLLCNVQELAENLQVLRDDVKKPVNIQSGFRTKSHNTKVGGAARSQHLIAKAADIKIPGLTPEQVGAKIRDLVKAGKMKKGGLSVYPTFTHYDVGPARTW
jgi:uncharacterized protein YcbK (DUF882 family)